VARPGSRSDHAGPIEHLSLLDDPRLQDYRHLREPSRRMGVERAQGIFTVEGHLSVEALLASPYEVRSILVTEAHADRYAAADVPVFALPSRQIEQLTGVHFHRGVLAAANRPTLPAIEELAAAAQRLLVLEAVNDHENIGALFRNAAAFGVDGVILDPTAADPLYRRATRVSLGHVLRVPFTRGDRVARPARRAARPGHHHRGAQPRRPGGARRPGRGTVPGRSPCSSARKGEGSARPPWPRRTVRSGSR
jgi:tRNA G18 (ribose-2'-O)-methylase SpoU